MARTTISNPKKRDSSELSMQGSFSIDDGKLVKAQGFYDHPIFHRNSDLAVIAEWASSHAELFEAPIRGPVATLVNPSCHSVAIVLEKLLPSSVWSEFYAESEKDCRLFCDLVRSELRRDVSCHVVEAVENREPVRPFTDRRMEELRSFGIEGYLDQMLECSWAVREVLLKSQRGLTPLFISDTLFTPLQFAKIDVAKVLTGSSLDCLVVSCVEGQIMEWRPLTGSTVWSYEKDVRFLKIEEKSLLHSHKKARVSVSVEEQDFLLLKQPPTEESKSSFSENGFCNQDDDDSSPKVATTKDDRKPPPVDDEMSVIQIDDSEDEKEESGKDDNDMDVQNNHENSKGPGDCENSPKTSGMDSGNDETQNALKSPPAYSLSKSVESTQKTFNIIPGLSISEKTPILHQEANTKGDHSACPSSQDPVLLTDPTRMEFNVAQSSESTEERLGTLAAASMNGHGFSHHSDSGASIEESKEEQVQEAIAGTSSVFGLAFPDEDARRLDFAEEIEHVADPAQAYDVRGTTDEREESGEEGNSQSSNNEETEGFDDKNFNSGAVEDEDAFEVAEEADMDFDDEAIVVGKDLQSSCFKTVFLILIFSVVVCLGTKIALHSWLAMQWEDLDPQGSIFGLVSKEALSVSVAGVINDFRERFDWNRVSQHDAEAKATAFVLDFMNAEAESVQSVVGDINEVLDMSDQLAARLAALRVELESGACDVEGDSIDPCTDLRANIELWDDNLLGLRYAVSVYVASLYLERWTAMSLTWSASVQKRLSGKYDGEILAEHAIGIVSIHDTVDEWLRQESEITAKVDELEKTHRQLSIAASARKKEELSSYFSFFG